jgi:hypothetical protein
MHVGMCLYDDPNNVATATQQHFLTLSPGTNSNLAAPKLQLYL